MRISNQENFKSSSATELSCRMAKNMFAFIGYGSGMAGKFGTQAQCVCQNILVLVKN